MSNKNASTSTVLRNVRAVMNAPIYAKAVRVANSEGDASALDIVVKHTGESRRRFFEVDHGRNPAAIREAFLTWQPA